MILFWQKLKTNVPCSYFHLHCDLSRASTGPTCSASVAHTKGTFIGTTRQSVEPQFVLALKIQIKYAHRGSERVWQEKREGLRETGLGFA